MTRKIGLSALGASVYTRLTTDDLTKTYSFYSRGDVPKKATRPYHVLHMGPGTLSAEFTTRDSEGEENVFEIHSWVDCGESDATGEKITLDYINNIAQAITGTTLSITGYQTQRVWLDYSSVIHDTSQPTQPVYHGVARFHVWMTPTS